MLEIIYQDEDLVVVNKPAGMLVHRTKLAADVDGPFALQVVRDQLNLHVYPVHRIDRPTSGILIFAKNPNSAYLFQKLFEERKIDKYYLAVCRGYTQDSGEIDSPISLETRNITQEALTKFKTIAKIEQPYQISRYPTSRYSLVVVQPITGRMHQIRIHFAKIRHYLIGDSKHGDLKHNKFFSENLGIKGLLLHANIIKFTHPVSQKRLILTAKLPHHFQQLLEIFNWQKHYSSELPNIP